MKHIKKITPMRFKGEDLRRWPIIGRRQKAIICALTKPMTSTQLAIAVHSHAPTLERAQTASLLNAFIRHGLVRCINPQVHMGKMYELTPTGRNTAATIQTGHDTPDFQDIPIGGQMYTAVHRSVAMRKILVQMVRHSGEGPISADCIRRWISSRYPVTYPVFYRGLARLQSYGLLRYLGSTLIGKHKMFLITKDGEAVARQLLADEI